MHVELPILIGRTLALALRGHLIALARTWRNCRTAVVLVPRDAVVRWQRDWLRRRWTDVRSLDQTAVHLLINRSASPSERWRRRTRCGERRGFMASCAHPVSMSQNARCRVCWNGTHVVQYLMDGCEMFITLLPGQGHSSSPPLPGKERRTGTWPARRVL
jgi:hypothetical protein